MNLNQLAYFYKAAKYHSINKAAKELYLSPSALSLSISALEKELGYKLFHRDHKGIFLTGAGELFLEDAKTILNMAENWKVIAKNAVMPHKTTVRLSTIPIIYNSVAGDIIIETLTKHEYINLSVSEQTVSDLEETLLQRETSCAIQAFVPDETMLQTYVENIGLEMEQLYLDRYVAFVGKQHPLFEKHTCTLDELKMFTGLSLSYFSVNRFDHQKLFDPQNTIYFHNQFALIQYLTESDCFTILPEILTKNPLCKNGLLRAIPIQNIEIPHAYALIHPPTVTLTEAEASVLNVIRQYFSALTITQSQHEATLQED